MLESLCGVPKLFVTLLTYSYLVHEYVLNERTFTGRQERDGHFVLYSIKHSISTKDVSLLESCRSSFFLKST